MEIYDFNNLLHKVKNKGEMFKFTNGKDISSVHFIKQTKRFLFVFNGKDIFSYKSLRHFRNRLIEWTKNKKLELIE